MISQDKHRHKEQTRWIQQQALDVIAVAGNVRSKTLPNGQTEQIIFYEDKESGMTISVTFKSDPFLQIASPSENGELELVFEVVCKGYGLSDNAEITVFKEGPWLARLNSYGK